MHRDTDKPKYESYSSRRIRVGEATASLSMNLTTITFVRSLTNFKKGLRQTSLPMSRIARQTTRLHIRVGLERYPTKDPTLVFEHYGSDLYANVGSRWGMENKS